MARSIGEAVTYVDSLAKEHPALLVAVHSDGDTPSVNLAYVSTDENRRDQYGRQVERDSSVVHRSNQQARGRYWY